MRLIYLVTLFFVNILVISAALDTYIVHVESPSQSHTNEDLDNWYQSFLPTKNHPPVDEKESSHIIHSYHHVFIGFSAKLAPEDVKAMEAKPGFISATPERILSLQTTHTPKFLGLHKNTGVWNQSNYGKGVIIGVLDTGIALNHPSFNDVGMPVPPAKWKGQCDNGTWPIDNPNSCNKKLIGARSFLINGSWPLDDEGHGTHTSSTAAGNFAHGANLFGNAKGTAAGIAPLAHVAMYQVCSFLGCRESDVIAGIDAAIDDGVDVISISLGGDPMPFYEENIAIGAYSATKKGIFVSCAAGNSGPGYQTVTNDAPWILTVGASTVDRKIRSTAVLGNKQELHGESLYQPRDFPSTQFPLYYPGTDPLCLSLKTDKEVKGKIVVCEGGKNLAVEKSNNVKLAGGVGIIIFNDELTGYTSWDLEPVVIPATSISYADGQILIKYINSTRKPTSAISFEGTVIGDSHAPQVASFSSRGPSLYSPGILKPDILGPGVNILAAWPEPARIAQNISSIWNIISGTSMACPHLSGIAALIKSAHPDWSPAAIKSAIITTADVENLSKNPIEDERQLAASIFAVGSGHVNPSKANDPGLVYDVQPDDYIPFLCGLNYTSEQVGLIVQRKVDCSRETSIAQAQLNYPSFTVVFKEGAVLKYSRTVTNVGEANSVYTVKVVAPQNANIAVNPRTLSFSKVNQKLTYDVTFTVSSSASNSTDLGQMTGGSLTWSSTKHVVRSPIVASLSYL